jgi:hypothetical protein
VDLSTVLRHDLVDDGEAEAGAVVFLGGEERLEDVRQYLRGNPGAVVRDGDAQALRPRGRTKVRRTTASTVTVTRPSSTSRTAWNAFTTRFENT